MQEATTKVHQNCVLVRTIHYDIMTTPQISKTTKCTSGGTSAYCRLQTEYKQLWGIKIYPSRFPCYVLLASTDKLSRAINQLNYTPKSSKKREAVKFYYGLLQAAKMYVHITPDIFKKKRSLKSMCTVRLEVHRPTAVCRKSGESCCRGKPPAEDSEQLDNHALVGWLSDLPFVWGFIV